MKFNLGLEKILLAVSFLLSVDSALAYVENFNTLIQQVQVDQYETHQAALAKTQASELALDYEAKWRNPQVLERSGDLAVIILKPYPSVASAK